MPRYTVVADSSSATPDANGRYAVDVSLTGHRTQLGALVAAWRRSRGGAKSRIVIGTPEAVARWLTATSSREAQLRRLPTIEFRWDPPDLPDL
jgi:hypothetical protein